MQLPREVQALAESLVAANDGCLLLSISEASRITGFSSSALRRAMYGGELVVVRAVPNGKVRILASEVARWLLDAQKRSKPVPA